MGTAVLIAQVLLAGVFAVAAAGKLLDLPGSRAAMAGFGLPGGMARAAGTGLPLIELVVAAALLAPTTARPGAAAALVLLVAFVGGIASALARGRAPDCNCFGTVHSAPAGRGTLGRNAVLAAVALFILAAGPGPTLTSWLNDHDATSLVAVAGVISTALLAIVSLSLRADKRGLEERLAESASRAQKAPPGLAVGAPAPAFTLPDTRGPSVSLDQLRSAGRPVALLFVDPGCGPCQTVLAELGRWQAALAPSVTIIAISGGQMEDSRAMAEEYDLAGLLVQEDSQLTDAYRIPGTPAAVVVGADATIARPPAVGADAIEALLRVIATPLHPPPRPAQVPA